MSVKIDWTAQPCDCGHAFEKHPGAGPENEYRWPCEECDCADYTVDGY